MNINFKAKILQFEDGAKILYNINDPVNIHIECRQLFVEHDGQVKFNTDGWSIPSKDVDWRTVKMTVNGESFYEGYSFDRSDNGILTWTDTSLRLRKKDTVFVEWTVNDVDINTFNVEALEDALYIVVGDRLVSIEYSDIRYFLTIKR